MMPIRAHEITLPRHSDSVEQSLAEKVIADGLMRARDEFIILMKL